MQDVEEDSVGLRKSGPARGSSSKRSRCAEVHNLSERVMKIVKSYLTWKTVFYHNNYSYYYCSEFYDLNDQRRRDRINEKMRALQELIPNCNKVHFKLHMEFSLAAPFLNCIT